MGFHFTFDLISYLGEKEFRFCPPVQVRHCGLAMVWMVGLKQASQPPSAQNQLLCPQPAIGGRDEEQKVGHQKLTPR